MCITTWRTWGSWKVPDVHVVSEQAGNLIVEVKGAHVALDKSIASKIVTC